MNRSVIIAAGITAALALYFAVGTKRAADRAEQETVAAISQPQQEVPLPVAIVTTLSAEPHPVIVEFKGQTAPDKVVTVKSGTVGTVVSTPAREGQLVNKGDIL